MKYLTDVLLDAAIDGYYPIVVMFGEKPEEHEGTIVAEPQPTVLQEIQKAKRDMPALRRGIWPQLEALNTLISDQDPMIIARR